MSGQTKFCVLAFCVVGTTAAAAQSMPVTIFTNLNAYSSATTATTIVGFNGVLPAGTTFETFNPLIVSGVTFSSPGANSSLDVTTASYYAPRYYSNDFLVSAGPHAGGTTLNITFPSPTYAAALDYGQLSGGGTATITLSNGFTYSPSNLPTTGSTAFFGFTSSTPITGLSYTVMGDAWVVEDVRFGTLATIAAFPTISMSLSSSIVPAGQSAKLTWSSMNASSCTASNSWSGPQLTSGTQIVTPALPGYYTYTLTCNSATYASIQSVVLTVHGFTPAITTSNSHSSYRAVFDVPITNQIVGLQTSMTVPPLPPVPMDPDAKLYLWPGLNPRSNSANFLPINVGLLQPVLTWGLDQSCPTPQPPAFSSWWISALYVNEKSSIPEYYGCSSGLSMLVNPGDVLLISLTLDTATGAWNQSVTDSATNQIVAFNMNLQGQGQNVLSFEIEADLGAIIQTPVVFSNTVITFLSQDFGASCASSQGTKNAYILTPPILSSSGTQCSIATIVLTQPSGPVPVPTSVVNAASFAKNASGAGSAVAPGSLIQVYSSLDGATEATAQSAPLPFSLGGVSVTFDGIPAAIELVAPLGPFPFINVQLPFEITNSSTSMVVTVNGVPSVPVSVPVVSQAPGIFTSPPDGQHNVIFLYVDPASGTERIAAPTSEAGNFTIPTVPILRASEGFFYATGLGSLAPPLADGVAPSLTDTTVYNARMVPTVLVGGVAALVTFAGQAPGYPGVNQINITIPANAPTGNAVPLQVISADGRVLSTPAATIAIQ
jgi:uncharacterized protein (TIGR03437 family)